MQQGVGLLAGGRAAMVDLSNGPVFPGVFEMTAVACCPRCFRQVSLPASEDHSVWVRCPHCGDQYSLQTAMDFVPPALEIVPAPALASEEESDGHETAAAAAAFESESIFAPSGDGADISHTAPLVADEDATVDSSDLPDGHVADDEFAAAVSLDDEPTTEDKDQPLLAEQEHAMDEAEHDTDEDFRFADEHAEGEVEFGHEAEHAHSAGEEDHPLGAIATMAAKPPKKKRPVPMSVRLIGYGMFIASGLLGLAVVYAASLYFGFSDPLKIGKHLPDWLVAKSLRGESSRNVSKPPANPESLRQTSTDSTAASTQQPGTNDAAAKNEPMNPPPSDEKTAEKPAVAENSTPAPSDSDAKANSKPPATDVAAGSPGKTVPSGSPFDSQPKQNDAGPATDDAAKSDPLSGAPKLPNLDMPDAKIAAKPSADNSPDKTAATGPEKAVTTTVEKPLSKPATTIAPKSDHAYTLADLTAAVDAATQANMALDEAAKAADEKAMTDARRHNFKAMSHLATVLSFVKHDSPESADGIKRLKDQIAASLSAASASTSAAERKVVSTLADKWVSYKERTEPGIFAAGTLKAVQARDSMFEGQLELADGKSLTVVTAEKPTVEDGQPVMLLGAIVNDPAKNLPEYKGTADPVIFAALFVAPASGR
jgi:hypothetical protein